VTGVVVSRAVLPFLCATGVPAARPDGLGAGVATSVTPPLLLLSLAATAACLGFVGVLWSLVPPDLGGLSGAGAAGASGQWRAVAAVAAAMAVTGLFARRCVRRFGGVTGDVLGACVEITLTTALLVSAFA
jgi:adenosylcobinamide-GDP ribazoletransferase